ncbi:ABC transporter permease [Victivallis vadensis]|jgi:ABC transporter, permease protein|uniref:ABC transporter permease n=1 Tax=Victivallis vadensis TaxID=172901 RepID=UPI00266DAACC|nr:ABC transporter permease [Victivallis vadensis]
MRPLSVWSKLKRNPLAVISLTVVGIYLLLAVGTELYDIYCEHNGIVPVYQQTDDLARYAPPSPAHWMGTDYQGRDVFLRAMAGSATAVKVGVIASVIAAVIGVTLGAIAGFYGGKFDDWVVWAYSTFASMPTLLFILAFALLVSRNFLSEGMVGAIRLAGAALRAEPGMLAVYFAIGLTGWVTLCRVVRGEAMRLRSMPYVAAARVAGVSSPVIIFRHILPNVFHLVIIYFTLSFAGAIMLEVIVSYLGFGVQSAPSWGVMISDGQERLWRGIWWEIAAATGFMFMLVLALNVLGDALRDALDPRQNN